MPLNRDAALVWWCPIQDGSHTLAIEDAGIHGTGQAHEELFDGFRDVTRSVSEGDRVTGVWLESCRSSAGRGSVQHAEIIREDQHDLRLFAVVGQRRFLALLRQMPSRRCGSERKIR